MGKQLFLAIVFSFIGLTSWAQELNCDVSVSTENVQQTDPTTFKTLEQKIREFMNETVWTKDEFAVEEKIECSINLNIIEEVSANRFKAVATIKSSRPVYNSTYETLMLNIIDKDFEFEFDPYTELNYRENSFVNNLTSALAFYAYTIIGYDYDSFSNQGGRVYHAKARKIVQDAAASQYQSGWNQSETNNNGDISRFWINNNLTESKYSIFRSQLYQYHRQGLDQLYEKPKNTWGSVDRTIQSLARFNKTNRNSAIIYMFFSAKAQEIVDVMSKAPKNQRLRVAEACMTIDPANTKIYRTLTK